MMAEIVYLLCTLTSLACAVLLFRQYRRSRAPLLFFSGLCFVGLTINNILLLVDLYLFPAVDLFALRTGAALAAMIVLLYGLVWNSP